MPTAKLSGLVRQFNRPAPEVLDDELLERFAASRDEAAFAELVRRYGQLVFAVCRRVTGNHHLSEDAFQAVFVVLAAKAGSVRPAALPGFLHAIATRTALRARTVADRRRRRETPVEALPDAVGPDAAPPEAADLAAVVDEEIAALPEVLRAAVVLCKLEGRSRKDAAERLGVPEGTVSSRLAAARKVLTERLRNRGIVLGAAGLSAVLGTNATAAVPAALAARALAAVMTPAVRPAAVAALSTGVLRIMLAQKLKVTVPLIGLTLGALTCVVLAADRGPAPEPGPSLVMAAAPVPPAPKPLLKGPNKLLYWRDGKQVLSDPDGKNTKEFALKERFLPGGQLSPDGKTIAYRHPRRLTPKLSDFLAKSEPLKLHLHVRALDDTGNGTDLGVECESFVWSPDGTEIACSSLDDRPGRQPQATSLVVRVASKERTELKFPSGHVITDWAPDGRFVTMHLTGTDPSDVKSRLYLMNRDGSEHKALAPDTNATMGHMSPDGTRVLCVLLKLAKETPAEKKKREEAGERPREPIRELAVLDVATGKFAKVQDVPLNADVQEGYCWSPDGKQIAYTWREKHEDKSENGDNKETESHLVVCDPDGTNAKTVLSAKGKSQWQITLAGVDWR